MSRAPYATTLIKNAEGTVMKLANHSFAASVLVLSAMCGLLSAPAQAQDVCALVNQPAASWNVSTPFEVIDGRVFVQAHVNGRGPFRFAVDTGASGMGRADSSLVSKLALPVHAQAQNSDGISSSTTDVVKFKTLKVGKLVRNDLEVMTRDYSGKKPPEEKFFGIIGREFFSDGLLIIDYPHRRLYFSKSLALPKNHKDVLHYERAFRVPVTIGDLKATGNLDTGANVTFVLPQSLYDQVSSAPLEKAGLGTMANNTIQTGKATLHGPFRVGGAEMHDVEVRVSDRYPELLVGAHFLQHTMFLIDQRSNAVALCQ